MNSYDEIDLTNANLKKIVKFGLEVFSNNTIEKVSTNVIVKKAGISRGLLYYYFKDKEDLFNFLIYFSFKKSVIDIYENIDFKNGDILKRLNNIFLKRLDLINEYPYILSFTREYVYETMENIKNQKYEHYRDEMYNLNIDKTLFINESDIHNSIKISKWTFAGILEEYVLFTESDKKNINQTKEELNSYYLSLRRSFYKNNEGNNEKRKMVK